MKYTQKNKQGAALLVYLIIMTFFIAILMTTTYSRLLLSVKRAEATTDSLSVNYRAESEVYDLIARLSGGYLTQNPLNINEVKTEGSTKLTIKGTQNGNTQTVSVTVDRPFASSKIIADRTVETVGSVTGLDIMLSLDCTSSMESPADSANPTGPTRYDALETAAVSFVNSIASRSDSSKFRLGVDVFGVDVFWLKSGSTEIRPDALVSFSDISQAISDGFNSTRFGSHACDKTINATSVGTPFVFSHDYFKNHKRAGVKQVEIVITDGVPNSRIPYSACTPDAFCPGSGGAGVPQLCASNPYGWSCYPGTSPGVCTPLALDFLRCSVADTTTALPGATSFGIRDPNVDAYAVTIIEKPQPFEVAAFNELVSIFNSYLGAENYYNAPRATDLTGILKNILNSIVTKHETITVKKTVPGV